MKLSKHILSHCDLGFQIFSLRILGIFLAYLNIIILANKLSVSQFGIYASVIALSSIIAIVLGSGCPGLSMRNLPRLERKGQKKFLIWHYTKITLASCTIALVSLPLLRFTNLFNYELFFIVVISLLTALLRFGETVLKSIEIQRWSIFTGGVLPHFITLIFFITLPLNLPIVLMLIAFSMMLSSLLTFLLIRQAFSGIIYEKFNFNSIEIKTRDVISTHYDHFSYIFLTLLVSLFNSGIIPLLRGMDALKEAAMLAISLKVIIPFQAARSAIIAQNTPVILKLLANDEQALLRKKITNASKDMKMYGLSILCLTIIYAYFTELLLPDAYSGLMIFMIVIGVSQCASLFLGFHQALHSSFDLKLRLLSTLSIIILLCIFLISIYFYNQNLLQIHITLAIALFLKFLIFYCVGKYGMNRELLLSHKLK